ncbi:MAG: zf-HC2 domain-containing protein [Anaerolineae bacterium]|nr:zf-HC2 domain-containing protein [Anaerolineae bacterium]
MESCSTPPPLSEEALSLALDGLADEETQRHLALCPGCSARLADMKQFEDALMKRLGRFDCPPAQELTDYQFGMLDEAKATAVRQHLASCPRCQDELALLTPFLDDDETAVLLKEVERDDAPNVIRPPRQVWQASEVEVTSTLRMARGLDDETVRTGRARSATVYLEAELRKPGARLKGQVVDATVDWTGALAELWQEGMMRRVRVLDDMCEFNFDLTDESPVSLFITALSGVTVAIDKLNLMQ